MDTKNTQPLFDTNTLFHDLSKCAEIAEVPFNAEAMRKQIEVFADIYSTEAITVRTTTHSKGERDVNFRYMAPATPHDPFGRLQAAGLLKLEGHPIDRVVPEVTARYPVWWGLDAAVSHGFEKLWMFLEKPISVDEILTLSSLPDSVRNYREHFQKFAPGYVVNIIGLDFEHKSLNIYPGPIAPGSYTPDKLTILLSDLGFDVPSQEELELVSKTHWFYYTFRWDSPVVQRLCFTVRSTAEGYPYQWHPLCKRFIDEAPVRAERKGYLYSPTYGRKGNYLKIGIDYQSKLGPMWQSFATQKTSLDD